MSAKRDRGVSQKGTYAADLLLGASRLRLLSVLLLHPGPPLHMRALGRLARVALGLLQRELKTLEQIGLVLRIDQGRTVVFDVQRSHPLVPALREIVLDSAGGLSGLLARHLAGLDPSASVFLHREPVVEACVLLVVSELAYERWLERTLPLETVLGRPVLLRVLRPSQSEAEVDLLRWQRLAIVAGSG